MASVFDNDQLTTFIDEFVTKVPVILKENPLTADLVGQVDRLAEEFETPFSLAIVGQMRIGKSSLMNGMIGRESAVVGVNETTATINFFKYGEGDLTNKFRVHWKDQHYQDFPCSEIEEWIGESEHAARTRFIEFFNDSDFFKKINLVDTPGTRSVIGDHGTIINGFLAEKRERETLQHGGKADAIVYVSGAVANVSTEDMLKEFQENTRLPGSTPYNSVAVLHKWETLNVERPYEEAQKKAAFMEKQFQQSVSKVIPLSGPLALAAKTLAADFWNDLVQLILANDLQKLQKNLERGDNRFRKRIEHGGELLKQSRLPWACFRTIVKHAIQEDIKEGDKLQEEVLRLSGIEILMAFIHENFIEKRNQIKSLTILKKAIEPCYIAQLRIKADIDEKEKLINSAEQSLSLIGQYITPKDDFLKPVIKFIQVAKEPFLKELERNKQTQLDLGNKTGKIEKYYNQVIGDMKTLSLLATYSNNFSETETNEIHHLCGSFGGSAMERSACYSKNADQAFDIVLDRIDFWTERRATSPSQLNPLFNHLEMRLEELADELEILSEDNE